MSASELIEIRLRASGLLCGCFTALGYVTQSLALTDTPAATVAFLGAVTVIVCPALSVAFDEFARWLAGMIICLRWCLYWNL